MLRHDYIMRVIQQAVDAIARMMGLREKGDHEAARREAEAVYDLLGVPSELAAAVDSATLAELLGHPDKIRAMAKLAVQEAELRRATGDPLACAAGYRRAAELTLEARSRAPHPDDASVLQELFRHFPTASLAARYRGELES